MNYWSRKILLAIIVGGWPQFAGAGGLTVIVRTDRAQVPVGKEVELAVEVRMDERHINALEGILVVPDTQLEILEVNSADSSIKLWIQPPTVDHGLISYAGIIPGEIIAERIRLFTLRARARTMGVAEISLGPHTILAADGLASNVPVDVQNARVRITAHAASWYIFWVVSCMVVIGMVIILVWFTGKDRLRK